MTEAMGKHIRELRIKGLGYQTIAIVVGSTKETVRYYCKTHGLMGEAELARLNYEENLKRPENCKCCGAKLIRNRHSGKKLFCSNRCRQSWWQKAANVRILRQFWLGMTAAVRLMWQIK